MIDFRAKKTCITNYLRYLAIIIDLGDEGPWTDRLIRRQLSEEMRRGMRGKIFDENISSSLMIGGRILFVKL